MQNTDDESRQHEPIAKNDEIILQKTDHEDLSEILKTKNGFRAKPKWQKVE